MENNIIERAVSIIGVPAGSVKGPGKSSVERTCGYRVLVVSSRMKLVFGDGCACHQVSTYILMYLDGNIEAGAHASEQFRVLANAYRCSRVLMKF
jgi:hypothetical protein